MLLLARRLAARAHACWMLAGLGVLTGGSAACVPLNDFDEYTPAPAGAGGASSPVAGGAAGSSSAPPLSEDPGSPSGAGGSGSSGSGSSGSGTGGSGNPAGSGAGSSPSATPSPDAGAPQPTLDAAPTPTTACAEGELEGPDASCFFLDARTQSFFAARDACQARGSGWDLASVRSAQVSAWLGDALTFEGWLLASDVASEGTWVWLDDGSPFWQGGSTGAPIVGAYSNWNATEPNGGNTTNCMRALPRAAGSANPDAPWADLGCSELRGGICRGPLQEPQ